MADHTVKVDISFQSILTAISSLETSEKHQLWELLETELFSDENDFPEDTTDVQAACDDYEAGDYITFEQYAAQRAGKST